jgi:transposase
MVVLSSKNSITKEAIMARGRKLQSLQLNEEEKLELQLLAHKDKASVGQRARIILSSASGVTNLSVAQQENTTPQTVIYWRNRFLKERVKGLQSKSRPGRPPSADKERPLLIAETDRQKLQQLIRRASTNQSMALRARIIMECAARASNKFVAKKLHITPQTVGKWRKRYIENGLDGLLDQPRPGAPRSITDDDVEQVIELTLETMPKDATHWSTRSMAKAAGLSQTAVARIWRAFALQPHRTQTFKLSSDPFFIEKVRDIVGLYLDPPQRAVVFCVDEKSQIQALERSQPLLPLRPAQTERHTHDYVRHGLTSLFAALDTKTGKVIGRCYRRHRSVEFRKFLNLIDKNVPKQYDVHLILDNYGTHKTALIHRWLVKRPRFHLHFTPTSASWLNLVECWFAHITRKRIRRGSFPSTKALEKAIEVYLQHHNEDPKPFVWSKTADEILDNIKSFCMRINNSVH